MRKFRFIGDPSDYAVDFENGVIYDYCVLGAYASDINMNVEFLFEEYPKDWQEVTEPEPIKLPSLTKREYFAGLAMQGQFTQIDKYIEMYDDKWIDPFIQNSIILADELLKQLENGN